jgi:hypothetical protein
MLRTCGGAVGCDVGLCGTVIPIGLPTPLISFLKQRNQRQIVLRIAFSTSMQPAGEASETCRQSVCETVQRLKNWGILLSQVVQDCGDLIKRISTVLYNDAPEH